MASPGSGANVRNSTWPLRGWQPMRIPAAAPTDVSNRKPNHSSSNRPDQGVVDYFTEELGYYSSPSIPLRITSREGSSIRPEL